LGASRRAAHSYVTTGNAQLLHVPATRPDGRSVRVLLLARPDADLDDTEGRHAIASGLDAAPRRRGRRHQGSESLASAVVKASHSARRIDLTELDHEHAQILSDDLEAALNDLGRLRGRLQRLGRAVS
jgi:hypothetical protein